jgi:hypothetical protein
MSETRTEVAKNLRWFLRCRAAGGTGFPSSSGSFATLMAIRRASSSSFSPIRPQQLLDGAKQFIVPIFQRDYSWGTKHCKQLWPALLLRRLQPAEQKVGWSPLQRSRSTPTRLLFKRTS